MTGFRSFFDGGTDPISEPMFATGTLAEDPVTRRRRELREWLAGVALQGMLTARPGWPSTEAEDKDAAQAAVTLADRVIARLDETEG